MLRQKHKVEILDPKPTWLNIVSRALGQCLATVVANCSLSADMALVECERELPCQASNGFGVVGRVIGYRGSNMKRIAGRLCTRR